MQIDTGVNQPLVSIVVATYRSHREHLAVAIGSALAQTWLRLEVIVADDSPDDGLRAFVAGFGDPRLRYQHNSPTLGVACNHWVAFGNARGEYVAVLNHDDWFAPTFVDRMVGALQLQSQAVLAFCDHWIIDASGRRLEGETHRNSETWGRATLHAGMHRPFTQLVAGQTIPMAMGTMFRGSALPTSLPADAGPAYDLWLTYLLARSGGGAWYVPERLSAWRSHDTNLTSGGGMPWLQGSAYCWDAIAADAQFSSVRRSALAKAARSHYACALRAWTDGRRKECIRFALRSLRSRVTAKGLGALLLLPVLPASLGGLRAQRRRAH